MTLQRGKKAIAKDVELGDIRSLAREDLQLLSEARPMRPLDKLRDNHHRVARAVASGVSNGEVAALCGISYSRVSQYRADPAFNELVAHYRGMLTAEWVTTADTVIEFLGSVRTKSLAMLEDKLVAAEEQGEFLPTRELVSMAELGLDRTGYGKVNKNVNINVDFAAQLEAARNRSRTAREANPVRETPTPPRSALAFDSSPQQSAPVQAPSQFRRRV